MDYRNEIVSKEDYLKLKESYPTLRRSRVGTVYFLDNNKISYPPLKPAVQAKSVAPTLKPAAQVISPAQAKSVDPTLKPAVQVIAPAQAKPEALPKGWSKHCKVYYIHDATETTQWKKPKSEGIDFGDGWKQYLNSDNVPYYANASGETHWNTPNIDQNESDAEYEPFESVPVAPVPEKPLSVAAKGRRIDNWIQIDPIIQEFCKQNSSIKLSDKPIITVNSELNKKQPLNGLSKRQQMALTGWKTLQTEPDGNCLIHALLQAISPTYRRIPREHRSSIGQRFRTEIFANEFDDPVNKGFVSNPVRWLETYHVNVFAEKYKINICAILETSGPGTVSSYQLSYFPQGFDHRLDAETVANYRDSESVKHPEYNTVFILCRNLIHFETIRVPFEPRFNIPWATFIARLPVIYVSVRNEFENFVPRWKTIYKILEFYGISPDKLRTAFIESTNQSNFDKLIDAYNIISADDKTTIKRLFQQKEEARQSFEEAAAIAQSEAIVPYVSRGGSKRKTRKRSASSRQRVHSKHYKHTR